MLVPGLTDDLENIQRVREIISPWQDAIERVEVLPFHNMGQDKWNQLGMHYQLTNVAPPKPEQVAATRDIFASAGFQVY